MEEKKIVASGGVGITGFLFIAFLILKLCGVIDWSWWWVTAPLWIPAILVILFVSIGIMVLGIKDRRNHW